MSGKLRLPSLNALRVFHAVAQHKSFRQAADELLVTPQAVGQQIKLLEDTLQLTLFERKGRSIELTESAILLSHYVKAGFDEFSEGVRRVTRPVPGPGQHLHDGLDPEVGDHRGGHGLPRG